MDATTRELNEELKELHGDMTSPRKQAERQLKEDQKKRKERRIQRIGL